MNISSDITTTNTDPQNYINELLNINSSNKNAIKNFSNFSILLDKIELKIKLTAKKDLEELIEIKNSIDENINIFKTICANTT